jgi:hypothetical protein
MEVNMKNTKWIWWTLGILLVLILIAGAGFSAYRMGYAHGAIAGQDGDFTQLMPRYHMRGFDGDFNYGMRGFHTPMFSGRGGFLPFFGIFGGLFQLAVLGLIVWALFLLVRNSGWRLVKTTAPATVTPPSADDEENQAA